MAADIACRIGPVRSCRFSLLSSDHPTYRTQNLQIDTVISNSREEPIARAGSWSSCMRLLPSAPGDRRTYAHGETTTPVSMMKMWNRVGALSEVQVGAKQGTSVPISIWESRRLGLGGHLGHQAEHRVRDGNEDRQTQYGHSQDEAAAPCNLGRETFFREESAF